MIIQLDVFLQYAKVFSQWLERNHLSLRSDAFRHQQREISDIRADIDRRPAWLNQLLKPVHNARLVRPKNVSFVKRPVHAHGLSAQRPADSDNRIALSIDPVENPPDQMAVRGR